MKKGSIILGSMVAIFLTGYGMWSIYKKICPECAEEMKDNLEDMITKKEKAMGRVVKDMM